MTVEPSSLKGGAKANPRSLRIVRTQSLPRRSVAAQKTGFRRRLYNARALSDEKYT